jgi:DNA polymerase-1
MHRPITGNFALLSIAHGDDVYILDKTEQISPALEQIKDAWWIIQNAKFDLTHLRRWANVPPRERVWDTMLIERILFGGYYDTFSLADLVRRHLFTHMEKELQKSFTGSEISAEQIQYSAMDAWVLPKIAEQQKRYMDKNSWHIWHDIDRPAMFAFMDFQGFGIDVEKWKDLARRNKARQETIDAELPVNPRSPKQVKEFLSANGFKRLKNSQADTLEENYLKYPNSIAAKVARNILESRMYGRRASTYGMDFIDDYLEYEGDFPYIYCNYWVTGAETGRTSADHPNMQNILVKDTKEFRECFIPRPGRKLLIADYSAQEVFIAAYVSQDKNMIDICNSDEDIYCMMAKMMYNIDITKKDPLRARMKAVVLGTNYGMSSRGLARNEGISVDEAEEVLFKFFKTFPGMRAWMSRQEKATKYVTTVAGRKCWLNPHKEQSSRNALNGPMQGGAADCTKMALGNLHYYWSYAYANTPFPMVGYIHDELVADVPEDDVPEWKENMETIMIKTANDMFTGMNFRADVKIADNWAQKD